MIETSSTAPLAAIESDLAALEARLAALVAYVHELRASNEGLRSELAASFERHRVLSEKLTAAMQRVDALIQRLPEADE